MDIKRIYCYAICFITLIVVMWGAIDVAGAAISLFSGRTRASAANENYQQSPDKSAESMLDDYYQKRLNYDRMGDGAVKLLIAGGIFIYFSKKLTKLEGGA